MIRLPTTSIDISQNELAAQLQHLDFCASLLKQGFKKHEIVRYFKSKNGSPQAPSPADSTYDLLSRAEEPTGDVAAEDPSSPHSPDETRAQFASPVRSPELSPPPPENETESRPVRRTSYVPRQSSLLRFARAVSPVASNEDTDVNLHFSPRSSITYRPRSKTYSYDQSEMDEEDVISRCLTPTVELEQLSLDDDCVAHTGSTGTTVQNRSGLRPDAQPFTPSYARLGQQSGKAQDLQSTPVSDSNHSSYPSSPPVPSLLPSIPRTPTPPSLPPLQVTESLTVGQQRSRQQFLDGSFTIYNDSMPARLQPQTPADLNRNQYLNPYNAAYTAPPGMIRSVATRQATSANRQASGELSPTAQATLIRERRHREYRRGLRVEGLRIHRTRGDTIQATMGSNSSVDLLNLWRDDLDADAVGEENFEERLLVPAVGGMRIVSGNQRPA